MNKRNTGFGLVYLFWRKGMLDRIPGCAGCGEDEGVEHQLCFHYNESIIPVGKKVI